MTMEIGTIKAPIRDHAGFAFIRRDNGACDIFFHARDAGGYEVFHTLAPGDRVTFDVGTNADGKLRAIKVRRVS
jgi:cold shock CspA family protein